MQKLANGAENLCSPTVRRLGERFVRTVGKLEYPGLCSESKKSWWILGNGRILLRGIDL